MSGPVLPISRPLKKRAHLADRAFLPADLEVLETPPSPVRMAMLLAICALVTCAILWAWVGKIDIIATASGKIEPTGAVKVVQPVEAGRVTGLLVHNGAHVAAGETLVTLDPTEADSERAAIAAGLASWRAEVLRRTAEETLIRAAGRDPDRLGPEDALRADETRDLPPEIVARERLAFAGDIRQLQAQLRSLTAQRAQKSAESARLGDVIAATGRLVDTMQARVDMHHDLLAQNAASKSQVLDATQTLQEEQARLADDVGQRDEAEAGIRVLDSDIARTLDTFANDNTQKLIEASRHVDELTQQLVKAESRLAHMTLKSPIAGTVQSLAVTTIGQVVATGQELMRIVPDDSALEVQAFLQNADKGFVREGQEAVIKVEAFPFERYGAITGEVVRVARDSIPIAEANRIEGDPTQPSAGRTPSLGDAEETRNLVYAVTIHPRRTAIRADGVDEALSPGMTVVVDIMTGQRRILEYLFSPLVEITGRAMRER